MATPPAATSAVQRIAEDLHPYLTRVVMPNYYPSLRVLRPAADGDAAYGRTAVATRLDYLNLDAHWVSSGGPALGCAADLRGQHAGAVRISLDAGWSTAL